jgi:cell division protein FtsW
LLIRSAREMSAADVIQFPKPNSDRNDLKTKQQEKLEASRRRSPV